MNKIANWLHLINGGAAVGVIATDVIP